MKRPVTVVYLRSEGVFAFCSRGRISHLETEPISLFEQIRWGRSQYGNIDLVYPKRPERLPVILTSIGAGSVDTAAKLVRIADGDTHFAMMKDTSESYHPLAKSLDSRTPSRFG